MSFDLANLKPGDEVGIEFQWFDGRRGVTVGIVAEIDPGGVIGLEGDEWYGPDGDYLYEPGTRRLVAPTDEGRHVSLVEGIGVDLNILGGQLKGMDLPTLRNLRAAVLGWIAGVETAARTNQAVSGPDRGESA